jgi:hypothetical protein
MECKSITIRKLLERKALPCAKLTDSVNWRVRRKYLARWIRMTAEVLAVFQAICPLKRCLLILSDLIFVSSVVRGMPSLAAAPEGP